MGAAASFDRKFDEATVKSIAGPKWDQELFDSLKDADACITIDQFLHAAALKDGRLDEPTVRLLSGGLFDEDAYTGLKDKDGCITTEQFLAVAHGSAPQPDPSLDQLVSGQPVSDDEATRHCYLDGKFLQHCSEAQRDNFAICAAAVTNRGNALEWCSPACQDNEQLVNLAILHDGTPIRYASPRLQASPDLVGKALKNLPSYSLKWDAVRLAADLYAKDGELFKAAPLAMRADKGVLLRVSAGDGLLLALAMPLVRRERSVLKVAVQQNVQSVFFAGQHALTADGSTEGPLDPDFWVELQELAAAQKAENKGLGWCPDAQAVAKQVERFPELAALSPPDDWLAECAARAAEEALAAEAKKERLLASQAAEEKKASIWGAGLKATPGDGDEEATGGSNGGAGEAAEKVVGDAAATGEATVVPVEENGSEAKEEPAPEAAAPNDAKEA